LPHNVEIKARVVDAAATERRARAIATSGPTDLAQDDTFFAAAHGRLKLREFADGRGQLIHYLRPDGTGPKLSDYVLTPVPDPAGLRESLSRAVGVIGRVRKRRRLYLVDRTRVHLDAVEGLGDFVELEVMLNEGETFEAGHAVAESIMASLGIDRAHLVQGAYLDLLACDGSSS
jgi:adenylate cyclase class IV